MWVLCVVKGYTLMCHPGMKGRSVKEIFAVGTSEE